MKPIITTHKFLSRCMPELPIEPTERTVHLGTRVQGRVYALRAVASSEIDLVITEDVDSPRDPRDEIVLEISRKIGKYDGRERDRMLFRRVPAHQTRELSCAEVYVLGEETDRLEVCVATSDGALVWTRAYRAWTDEIANPEAAGNIVLWHWRRYYSFLSEPEVRAIAGGFPAEAVGLTLASANRLASRRLYSLARESGWRKLTLREQRAWGLEGQWHRVERIDSARQHRHSVGEHTLLAASMANHIEKWMDS